MVVILANPRPHRLFHHVQAGAERQSKANQRHHQQHMVAEIIDKQLHQQNVQTSQYHADHAPERAQHRATIMHRKQDQNTRHQRRQRIAQVTNLKDHKIIVATEPESSDS